MIALDPAGRIVSMSRAAETLFGYEQKEAAGESFLMLFAPQSQSEAASRFEAVKQDGDVARAGAGEELVGRDRRGSVDRAAPHDGAPRRRRRRSRAIARWFAT